MIDPRPAAQGWFDANILTGAHPAHRTPSSAHDVLAAHLDRYEFSGALLGTMASWLHDPMIGNAEASRVAEGLADRGVLAVWAALPPTPGEVTSLTGLVARAVDAGVAAFRVYPRSHGFSATDPVMDELYAELTARRIPLCLDRPEIDWQEITTLASRFPTLPLIVSQVGYRELRALATALGRHPALHIDLANFAAHQAVEWLVDQFDADRLLFATGLGLRDPGESVVRLAWSGLGHRAVQQIGQVNASRLLGRQQHSRVSVAAHRTNSSGAA